MDIKNPPSSHNQEESTDQVKADEPSMVVDREPSVTDDQAVPMPTLRIIPPPPNVPLNAGLQLFTAAASVAASATEDDAPLKPQQKLRLILGGVSMAGSQAQPPPHSLPISSTLLTPDSAPPLTSDPTSRKPVSALQLSTSSRLTTPSSALTPQSGLRWKPRQGSMTSEVSLQTMATIGSANSRGKSGRDKQGWGNVPVGLMHIILSHAMNDLSIPYVIEKRHNTQANELALVILRRVWLCKMRTVSTGWRNAVDSHPFWPEYTLEMDQSRRHGSTLDDLEASSLTPSTPSFPTLFHRARHTTLHVCLACRLNHPDRVGLYPAVRKRLTPTASFGATPTCERHHATYCSSCMREQELTPQTRVRGGVTYNVNVYSGEYIGLRQPDPMDTDQSGVNRGGGMLCAFCRRWNLEEVAGQIISQCARGTALRGMGPWLKWDFDAAKSYIDNSLGTLMESAWSTVDEYWLESQTRWQELYPVALDLQTAEEQLRLVFLVRGIQESPRARGTRLFRLAELEGIDADEADYETPDRVLDDAEAMKELYDLWEEEALGVRYTERDLREFKPPTRLNRKWWKKLFRASINDWVRDRVRHGFWIAPSDEVQNYVDHKPGWDPEDETDFRRIALGAEHPFPDMVLEEELRPQDAYCDSFGIIYVSNKRTVTHQNHSKDRASFFPPRQLLDALDFAYADRLRDVLRPALVQCAKLAWYRAQDEELAEEVCSKWTLEALLALLHRQGAWAKDGLMIEEVQRCVAEKEHELALLRARNKQERMAQDVDLEVDQETELGDEIDGIKPDYMIVDVDADTLMSDTDDNRSIETEERGSIRPIHRPESVRQTSPRIELVVEDEEAVENPANIQEVTASPEASMEDATPRIMEITQPFTTPAPAPKRVGGGHLSMDSIDDVLKMQAELLARAPRKPDTNGHSGRSVSGASLGKRKQAPDSEEHDIRSPEKKSPSHDLSEHSMSTLVTMRTSNGIDDVEHFGKAAGPPVITLKPSPPLFPSSLPMDDPSRSPKSTGSTSAASTDPSSDVTSGPALLTPPDDSHLDPALLHRANLPEHLRDAPSDDIKAIIDAGGLPELKKPLTSKGSSSTLTSITLSDGEAEDTSRMEWETQRPERGSKKFPLRLEPLMPAHSIPWVPPLPAYALGSKTSRIIRQLWWDVRADLRVCKCSVCKRRLEMDAFEDDDEEVDEEVDEDIKVVDPKWSLGGGAKRARLG